MIHILKIWLEKFMETAVIWLKWAWFDKLAMRISFDGNIFAA